MKKVEIYTNLDNQDFCLLEQAGMTEKSNWNNYLHFQIQGGSCNFYFLSPEEVDEFCELLQEKKKEIWKS